MNTDSAEGLLILVGTREGIYLYEGTCARDAWTVRGPYLEGLDIGNAILDPRDRRTIWATGTGNGSTAAYRSDDLGHTWQMAGEPFDCEQVWQIHPGHASQPDRVYLGIKPAALFQTDDRGATWQPVMALNAHASAPEWWEGGAGKVLHTIVTDPDDPNDLTVGISVAGVFHSADGGGTWTIRNRGMVSMAEEWAKMMEGDTEPQHLVHSCVHKVVRHPQRTATLYQQNHDGMFRSDDRGLNWVDISEGLPDRFGFVCGATIDGSMYVVPQNMENIRFSGQLEVYRRRDGCDTWDRLVNGLPSIENITLYRDAMATDHCTPGGIYFGTSSGDVYASRDGGEGWTRMAADLPPVRSVECGRL